jgi:hypothetical protein
MARKLTNQEIDALASRPSVRRIAVENFLISVDLEQPFEEHMLNAGNDAVSYGWNEATRYAIEDGLRLAYDA